jgi:outer membrane protein TolC
MKAHWFRWLGIALVLSLLPAFSPAQPSTVEGLPFRRAIELALSHSTEIALGAADEQRAYASYRELKNAYYPQVGIGSAVGYAYGFPLGLEGSAPTLFNVTSQSQVWNPAQQQFIKAAKTEWGAAKTQGSDQRGQVLMETALTYIELSHWQERLPILRSELKVANDIEYAVSERIKAGVDSPIDQTKAKLAEAQVRVNLAEAEGAIDVLRTRLSQLTGVPVASIATVKESIPVLPEVLPADDTASRAASSSAAVELANQTAVAKEFKAKGEHRAALWPSASFAAQYGLINATLTDYAKFFQPGSFQTHNVTFGLVLRMPFLDMSQRARAQAADAEALRARKEAERVKNKTALDAVKMQHDVQELSAARDVAELRSEIAQNQLDAAHAKMEAETATQRELQNAAIEAAEKSLARISADFDVQRASIELRRATGELEGWAMGN